ncbi:MAG TPA: HTH domain-containing protein [Bacteroidales bacterium]|nr:HTH domain-containing protein [Bacteroidales bacterium]
MAIITFINRLKRIDFLVYTRTTGTPSELAVKLGISVRSIYDYINDMRELGAPVVWSNNDRSYVYIEEGRLHISFMSSAFTSKS